MDTQHTAQTDAPQQQAQGLATVADAAAFFSVSRSTLWRLERAGVLRGVRIGRALRFRWSDLRRIAGVAQ